jgi:hypothetical protein
LKPAAPETLPRPYSPLRRHSKCQLAKREIDTSGFAPRTREVPNQAALHRAHHFGRDFITPGPAVKSTAGRFLRSLNRVHSVQPLVSTKRAECNRAPFSFRLFSIPIETVREFGGRRPKGIGTETVFSLTILLFHL